MALITADDWGLSAGVNEGILELAQMGIIKRVSVMANGSALTHGLNELKSIPCVSLGLHFNLSYGDPFTHWKTQSPKDLVFKRNYSEQSVIDEAQAQLCTLKQLGIPVHYWDSHHHVHLAPRVLKAIIPFFKTEKLYHTRLPLDLRLLKTSQMPIPVLSLWARKLFVQNGFHYLPFVYPTQADLKQPNKVQKIIQQAKTNTEILFHPAKYNDLTKLKHPDTYQNERVSEFHLLREIKVN
jgi:predicted glycoside hydrolase/deacetylase ChbG (UPF0249 family)